MRIESTHHAIAVDDRRQSVCNDENAYVLPYLRPQALLNDLVRIQVNRGRRFIQDEQLASAHHRPRKRDDLSLSDGEIGPARSNRGIEMQAFMTLRVEREQSSGTKGIVQCPIVVLAQDVEVPAERSGEKLRLYM
jgi:hypothetical protein